MTTENEPLAIMGTTVNVRTMADGTLRIALDIQPDEAVTAFQMFGVPGSSVAIVRLTDAAGLEAVQPKNDELAKGPYGEEARALVLSGFFLAPDVLKAIGSDDEFLTWLKFQKSAYSGKRDYDQASYQSYCVAAHVRRVASGAGTGIKPNYSAIPLTDEEHKLQHLKGESALGDREWWDKKRDKYVLEWARNKLKDKLTYNSWTNVPPKTLCLWAHEHGVLESVPYMIRDECGILGVHEA